MKTITYSKKRYAIASIAALLIAVLFFAAQWSKGSLSAISTIVIIFFTACAVIGIYMTFSKTKKAVELDEKGIRIYSAYKQIPQVTILWQDIEGFGETPDGILVSQILIFIQDNDKYINKASSKMQKAHRFCIKKFGAFTGIPYEVLATSKANLVDDLYHYWEKYR